MNQEQMNKATALIAAGIDDDTIIEALNISLSQLEKFKNGGKQTVKAIEKKHYPASKITEEKFERLKAELAVWKGTNTAFSRARGLSPSTFYRIKHSSCYADYKNLLGNMSSGAYKGGSDRYTPKVTEEFFERIKAAQKAENELTVNQFCTKYGVSTPTYYRIKRASTYDEYRAPRGNAPAQKTVGIYHEPKKDGDFSIKVEHLPKETQDEVLERIASSLETISYKLHIIIENQAKTKKRGWFRK